MISNSTPRTYRISPAGGFSPKESIYDEVSTIAGELPLRNNEFPQKPLDGKKRFSRVDMNGGFGINLDSFFSSFTAPTIHEHKSNATSTETTLTFPINQTTTHEADDAQQPHNVIPDFKKISTNFTSYIDVLLHGNVLDVTTTTTTTTKAPTTAATTTTTKTTTRPLATSTSQKPIKSIINDDDFIMQHLKAPTSAVKSTQGVMEIFSKPTKPTMNGLLKLAGCNIYGQMYDVGHVIKELSDECLECKCLPDVGVGCFPKC